MESSLDIICVYWAVLEEGDLKMGGDSRILGIEWIKTTIGDFVLITFEL